MAGLRADFSLLPIGLLLGPRHHEVAVIEAGFGLLPIRLRVAVRDHEIHGDLAAGSDHRAGCMGALTRLLGIVIDVAVHDRNAGIIDDEPSFSDTPSFEAWVRSWYRKSVDAHEDVRPVQRLQRREATGTGDARQQAQSSDRAPH